ncbi:hypothetical protein KX02_1860 (plasmid) [Francisella tularensis subsp. novicida]|nr:hypothetical protein KX02_1860 [Francisella tularensis subsp. novicida]
MPHLLKSDLYQHLFDQIIDLLYLHQFQIYQLIYMHVYSVYQTLPHETFSSYVWLKPYVCLNGCLYTNLIS